MALLLCIWMTYWSTVQMKNSLKHLEIIFQKLKNAQAENKNKHHICGYNIIHNVGNNITTSISSKYSKSKSGNNAILATIQNYYRPILKMGVQKIVHTFSHTTFWL